MRAGLFRKCRASRRSRPAGLAEQFLDFTISAAAGRFERCSGCGAKEDADLAKEEEPQRSGVRWGGYSPAFVVVASFFAWFALIAFAFRDTQSTFLRAESGWYQLLSHSDAATRASFTRLLFTSSYHGHYTPVAFFVEFKLSEWIGPVGSFWKWRQITIVAAIATALFFFVCSILRKGGAHLLNAAASAAGMTSLLVFQPAMRELVAWPFMVMQLGWILCSLSTLACLAQFAAQPQRKRWVWLAAGSAYASMHLLGLGVVTVLGTQLSLGCVLAAAVAGRLPQYRPVARQIAAAFTALTLAAAVHSVCMLAWLQPESRAASAQLSLLAGIGFIAAFFLSVVSTLAGWKPDQHLDVQALRSLWPAGLLLIGGGALLLGTTGRALQKGTPRQLSGLICTLFSSAFFFGSVALMAVRLGHDPAVSSTIGFLSGARYLVPASFGLVGFMAALGLPLIRRMRLVGALFLLATALEALVAQRVYAATRYRTEHPRDMISHAAAWRSIGMMARECRAANLPIPNVPLGTLTQEFYDWDLQLFEPLLRAELHLEPNEPLTFASWDKVRGDAPEYAARVPSLRELTKLLELSPPPATKGH